MRSKFIVAAEQVLAADSPVSSLIRSCGESLKRNVGCLP